MLPCFTRKPVDHPLGFLVALSGLLMQLMSYGIDNSYSIFSDDMHKDPSLGYPSVTTISLGNSVSLGLSPAFGVLCGFLVDRVPPRLMMAVSTLMLFAGLWLSSTFAHNVTAVTFSYCLLASISSACMLSPGAAATSSWFNRYQGLAMGINFSGGGVGSAIIPSLAGKWVVAYGWRKTFRLMSAFCAIGVVATLLSARRAPPKKEGEGPSEYDEGQERQEQGEEEQAHTDEENRNNNNNSNGETAPAQRGLHTHKLNPWELFLSMFSRAFLGNFFCWLIFSWAFYSLIYVAVPYVSSMGKAGTVYADISPIPTDIASTLFTFYGVFQIVGSILVGWLATGTTNEFAYVLCATIGGIFCAFLGFCRSYVAFALLLCVIGFCMAGMFAVMPALIAERLYGPNLGFYMGAVFLAGVVGGFSAPPIQAELQQRHYGNYTYVCVFMSACMTLAAAVCYITMWRDKRVRIVSAAAEAKLA
ncbi:putative transporter [Trypanosoma cruzi]|uniref:Riboflavin transporter RibJ n=1 Tax=Trypanosoma cruzi TaxID=5693 RepID=A0A2V2V9T4_TRYCR|nr:putative transporter [Trypanosoma cruzi]PWU93129.1 putative transporter [Trypanosoma cruzi]RNF14126.1 putative transporter [Trypanosoma cruzi]